MKTIRTNNLLKLTVLLTGLAVLCLCPLGAATLLVYNANDSGAGSLRQAIADNRSLGGGNTIVFSNVVTGTIKLTTGELLISNNVTILGPGANALALNANAASRVFRITNAATAVISGLSITNGHATDYGGGIYNDHSTLTVSNCTLSGNSAGNQGGALFNNGQTSGNASLTLTASTLSGNSANQGGGIYTVGFTPTNASLSVFTSTLSSNSASSGGGIFNYNATLALTANTLGGNSASSGGGIFNLADPFNSAPMTLGDTILQAGASGENIYNNRGAVTSLGYDLSSDGGVVNVNGGTGSLSALGDQINTDPMLGPLQDNGGPTPTMMPLPGSPAIDQGKNFSELTMDQRGRYRTYDDPNIPNATGGDGTDIGAVEINLAHSTVVNTTNDNGLSLRWCIGDAQPGDTITFAPAVTNMITLTGGELLINRNLTIQGPGANILCVNGNHASRVFHILSGANVGISGLTITNGSATGTPYPADSGGGIYNDHATLTVSNCAITGNSAAYGGAGIFNYGNIAGGATLTVVASTISDNSASYYGAGILNDGEDGGNASVTVVASTIHDNNAGGGTGGGIANDGTYGSGTLTVLASTLSGNSAVVGGGILNSGSDGNATVQIGDVILKTGSSGENIFNTSATITSLGYNLSSDNGGGFLTALGDQINTDLMLGPLQNNGGPTPTMAPLSNSPAIDKGKSFGLTTDQRGAPRPFDFSSIANASGGDGSDIGVVEFGRPTLNIQKLATAVALSWPSYYGDFSLQSSTNIASSNSWITTGGAPAVVGNQFLQTNSPISGSKFFRLKSN